MTTVEIVNKLTIYSNAYYHGTSLINDDAYDEILTTLEERDPTHPYLAQVGSSSNKNKVKLPYYMGSLNKMKLNTTQLDNYKEKYEGPYIITDKLDGIAGLLQFKNNQYQLYTRGNGILGHDISAILPHLHTLPKPVLPLFTSNSEFHLKCELIIPKSKWESNMGSNPRNVTAQTYVYILYRLFLK